MVAVYASGLANAHSVQMLSFSYGKYTLSARVGSLPGSYSDFVSHAVLSEDLGIRSTDGTALFFAVNSGANWHELVVAYGLKVLRAAFLQDFF